MRVRRAGELTNGSLKLEPGWRRQDDTSWRTGHWILRRSMLGGMKLEQLSEEDRAVAGSNESVSLKVGYVGNWGPFGVAKRSGVQQGDIIVTLDGRSDFARESDVFEYVNENKQAGDHISLVLLRDGKTITARYKIQ